MPDHESGIALTYEADQLPFASLPARAKSHSQPVTLSITTRPASPSGGRNTSFGIGTFVRTLPLGVRTSWRGVDRSAKKIAFVQALDATGQPLALASETSSCTI